MHENDPRAAEARRLRTEEGLSRQQIRDKLRVGNDKLDGWLKNVPPPEWTKRPNAKDRLRDMARKMREEGRTYDEIVEALQVSKSSVSLWTRDVSTANVPAPGWSPRARVLRAESDALREARHVEQRQRQQRFHEERLRPFSNRDLEIAAVMAYWCEGSKIKPWGPRTQRVAIINSDPALLRLFLRYLEVVSVSHGGPTFRLHIHESASEARAKEHWSRELGIDPQSFLKTTWKRHNPKTVRKNVGDKYHGCLIIAVRKSSDLYWHIEDVAKAALTGMSDAGIDSGTVA